MSLHGSHRLPNLKAHFPLYALGRTRLEMKWGGSNVIWPWPCARSGANLLARRGRSLHSRSRNSLIHTVITLPAAAAAS